jgi:hypothetical protein
VRAQLTAQGGCCLETEGRAWELREPHFYRDATRGRGIVPAPLRVILAMLNTADFLERRGRPMPVSA